MSNGSWEPRHVPVERFTLRAVGRTDVGAQRTQNEDAMYFDDFLGNYVVCDGMGGHASGQVASDVAIRTIIHALKTGDPAPAPGQDHDQRAREAGLRGYQRLGFTAGSRALRRRARQNEKSGKHQEPTHRLRSAHASHPRWSCGCCPRLVLNTTALRTLGHARRAAADRVGWHDSNVVLGDLAVTERRPRSPVA